MGELAVRDGYGMAAYSCAADGTDLEPVEDARGVLRCPRCGHRTDEPGEGVLDDGFDVVHRQWGLRGDPHVWRAMRDLVGATPTPPDRDTIRAAYIDAIRHVADIDVDTTEEPIVYRSHLDHGGMSGGGVNVEWWKDKGIPLLVDRAGDRRPPSPLSPPSPPPPLSPTTSAPPGVRSRRGVKKIIGDVVVWVVVLAIPAATIGGGGFLLYQRAVGTHVEATVLDCVTSGGMVRGASTSSTRCIAEWTIDGREVVGSFNGGNGVSDVGKTFDATVRGDTAYSRSLGLPILLLVLGLPFLALPVAAVRSRRRRRQPSPPAR